MIPLVVLAQVADLATFLLGISTHVEGNPLVAAAWATGGPLLVIAWKAAGVGLAFAVLAHYGRSVGVGLAIIAAVGLLGAIANVVA